MTTPAELARSIAADVEEKIGGAVKAERSHAKAFVLAASKLLSERMTAYAKSIQKLTEILRSESASAGRKLAHHDELLGIDHRRLSAHFERIVALEERMKDVESGQRVPTYTLGADAAASAADPEVERRLRAVEERVAVAAPISMR